MKEKFYAHGFDGMADHEVLELLLYFGIPQKNTNELAYDLIKRFGSFSSVFEAKRQDLMSLKGMTESAACLITMVMSVYRRYMEDIEKRKSSLTTTEEIVNFLKPLYLDCNNNERVYVLCFDANHYLIACRMLNEGDIASSNFDLRKLTATVLETNAASVVISHNHPHGVTLPSKEDVETTKLVYEMLSYLKVKLHDHVIISQTSYNSLVNMPRFAHLFYGLDPLFDN